MTDERFNSGRTRSERQRARSTKLEGRSSRLLRESAAAEKSARRYLPDPPDQPILVGHHSERRHRNALKKWDRTMRKAIELWRASKETERRARAAAENAAIRATDADAVELLELRKAELEAKRDYKKALNEAWRACGRPKPDDADGWNAVAEAMEESPESFRELRTRMARHWREGAPPFDTSALQNLGANIRRIAKRIEDVEKAQTMPARPERRIGEVIILDNPDFDAVELHFPAKPADQVIALLKSHGFRWVRTAGCWSRRGRNATTEWKLGVIAKAIGAEIKAASDSEPAE